MQISLKLIAVIFSQFWVKFTHILVNITLKGVKEIFGFDKKFPRNVLNIH